jgi:hypothetical protein
VSSQNSIITKKKNARDLDNIIISQVSLIGWEEKQEMCGGWISTKTKR